MLKLDAVNARVVVGPRAALGSLDHAAATDVNWLAAQDAPFAAARSKCAPCARRWRRMVTPLAGGAARVELAAPEDAIAPGQACVFYDPDGSRVLGGGWITAPRTAGAGCSVTLGQCA